METLTIEIDVAFDNDLDSFCAINPMALRHNVYYVIVSEEGPTGWPVVRIHGLNENVKAFFKEYDGENNSDIYDFIVK